MTLNQAICSVFSVTVSDLMGRVRKQPRISDARTVAMVLAWQMRDEYDTMSSIGAKYRKVGWTVHHALKRHDKFMLVDERYREKFEKVKQLL